MLPDSSFCSAQHRPLQDLRGRGDGALPPRPAPAPRVRGLRRGKRVGDSGEAVLHAQEAAGGAAPPGDPARARALPRSL